MQVMCKLLLNRNACGTNAKTLKLVVLLGTSHIGHMPARLTLYKTNAAREDNSESGSST